MELEKAKQLIDAAINEMEKVIVGKQDILRLTITALLANGHVLFEDVPGVGKTTLAKTMATTFAGSYNRVQFTPDLLPSDIIGVSIFDRQKNEFEFKPGPIFATFLLADEINRATPRTQSALLEAMAENRVTLDGTTHSLNESFFVLATQNPADYEGTYPLPEAQMDRFMMRLSIGYPDFDDELDLLTKRQNSSTSHTQQVVSQAALADLKQTVQQVKIDPILLRYILDLATATREHPEVRLGISPRGSLALASASRAFALANGRDYVIPADIQALINPVFSHRLILQSTLRTDHSTAGAQILAAIVAQIPVPTRR